MMPFVGHRNYRHLQQRKDLFMCFRPPDANVSKVCEKCGTENDFMAVICEECGTELPQGGMPGAPAAPAMPKAPGAPGMPSIPPVPKTPGQ